MHRILRCILCVVWVTSELIWIISALTVFGQQKVMLNVTYPKAQNTAYNRRPIQGACTRGLQTPSYLLLRIVRESKPDFVIDIRKMPNKRLHNLDSKSEGIRMSILSKTGPWGQKVWFKLCITSDFEGAKILCELQRSEQERIAYAVSAMTFKNIPTRPSVSMKVQVGPNILFKWHKLELKCKAVVDRRGHLGYKLTTRAGRTYYWNITWASNDVAIGGSRFSADITMKKTHIVFSQPYIETTFHMLAIPSLDGGRFSCYASDLSPFEYDVHPSQIYESKGIRKEVHLKSVTVKEYYPYTPYLLWRANSYWTATDQSYRSKHVRWYLYGACTTTLPSNSLAVLTLLLRTEVNITAYVGKISDGSKELQRVELMKTVDYHDTPLLSFDAQFDARRSENLEGMTIRFRAILKESTKFAAISCTARDLMRCGMFYPGPGKFDLKSGASSTKQNIEKAFLLTIGLIVSFLVSIRSLEDGHQFLQTK